MNTNTCIISLGSYSYLREPNEIWRSRTELHEVRSTGTRAHVHGFVGQIGSTHARDPTLGEPAGTTSGTTPIVAWRGHCWESCWWGPRTAVEAGRGHCTEAPRTIVGTWTVEGGGTLKTHSWDIAERTPHSRDPAEWTAHRGARTVLTLPPRAVVEGGRTHSRNTSGRLELEAIHEYTEIRSLIVFIIWFMTFSHSFKICLTAAQSQEGLTKSVKLFEGCTWFSCKSWVLYAENGDFLQAQLFRWLHSCIYFSVHNFELKLKASAPLERAWNALEFCLNAIPAIEEHGNRYRLVCIVACRATKEAAVLFYLIWRLTLLGPGCGWYWAVAAAGYWKTLGRFWRCWEKGPPAPAPGRGARGGRGPATGGGLYQPKGIAGAWAWGGGV
jgi:hypothetical protein